MRIGGPIFTGFNSPEEWIKQVSLAGYTASYNPVNYDASDHIIAEYAQAALENDIVIAEVGAWSNPLSINKEEADKSLVHCIKSLELAEKLGARCCVNIAGSRGLKWDGPAKEDLSEETKDMIVKVVRKIIDAVSPEKTFYTLETMPWMYPDSADSYGTLLGMINRPAFAVHFDPVNLINTPWRFFYNDLVVSDFINKLGVYIKSCHIKDITLRDNLTVHLDEVRAGEGGMDYIKMFSEIAKLGDIPIMLEHLPDENNYQLAFEHLRKVIFENNIGTK
jgi:sugar phosphate isomerase/epimerase